MLTTLGRNVLISIIAIPFLWWVGYFDSFLFFLFQTIVVGVFMAIKFTPPRPDPDMDPVTAACMHKKTFLPPGCPSHLTFVMYFDNCPTLENVTRKFEEVLLSYDRLHSIPVRNPQAVFEASWEKVPLDIHDMIFKYDVESEEELDVQINGITLGTIRPLEDGKPLWRVDILSNTNGRSVVIWIIDHMFGDGIGLLPLAMKMATNKNGEPYKMPQFNPNRNPSKGSNIVTRVIDAAKDIVGALTIPNGPFDTTCSLNKNPLKPKLDYNGKRVVASIPDFPLQYLVDIKNAAGVTINDIFVALWAGTLRRYLQAMKDPALNSSILVRGQAPFSFPRKELPGKIKNDLVFISFKFPVEFSSMKDRLKAAHEEFERLKKSPVVYFLKSVANIGLSLGLDKLIADTNLSQWHRVSWVFSNVPGPSEELLFFGEKLVSFKPYYANLVNQAIFFSYSGRVSLAMVLDNSNIEHPEHIGKFFLEELEAMKKEFGVKNKEKEL